MPVRFLSIVLLASVAISVHAAQYSVRPPGPWVQPVPVDYGAAFPKRDVRWGVYALLDDHQSLHGTSNYYRRVRAVLSPAGVDTASELAFDFDPSFERLTIHEIAIVRGGRRIDALETAAIRVIDKEDDSDQRIYDGMLSAIAVVNDIRPGDILDYSWSVEGANPLLGGRFADSLDLTASIPTRLIRHRLVWPASSQLRYRSTIAGIEPQTATLPSGDRELIWSRRDVAPLDVEDNIPDWFDPYDHVALSDFSSWQEVAGWAYPLFRLDDASRDSVRRLADRIRHEHVSHDDQLVAAIRFVQDEIRYLGIEMGRNSHEPHQPAVVLEQRWGDCKDKSLLLASLLRELGVDADPALVSTRIRHELDHELPSPMLFDHVITVVRKGGRTYWIDPTLSDQGGRLDTIETPDDERALVVNAATGGLTRIATVQKGSTVIDESYLTSSWNSPTTLTVRSTFSGGDADVMRSRLATLSVADLEKDHLNRYALDHPKIAAAATPRIDDDRNRNTIVITERYLIRDLWTGRGWTHRPRILEEHLRRPDTMIRSMPLAFDFPLHVVQRTRIELPGKIRVETGRKTLDARAFHYESTVETQGTTILIRNELTGRRDGVTAAESAEHLASLNEIRDGSGIALKHEPENAAVLASLSSTQWAPFAAAMMVVLAVGLAASLRRRT